MPSELNQYIQANLGWLYYKYYFENTKKREPLANINCTITQRTLTSHSTDFFDVKAKHFFPLSTTYPGLLIGSGYTHEYVNDSDKDDAFKIGFFFDPISGIPCIPGHSVKGALRAVFPNHKDERYREEKSKLIVDLLKIRGVEASERLDTYLTEKKILGVIYTEQLFSELLGELIFEGNEPVIFCKNVFEYTPLPLSKRDIFHDAFTIIGDKNNLILGRDYITPHDEPLKDPKPLQFLKILPEVIIQFQFNCEDNLISGNEKKQLFEDILVDFGVGAKTNVGYGQLREVTTEEKKEIEEKKQAEEKQRKADQREALRLKQSDKNEIDLELGFKKGEPNEYIATVSDVNEIFFQFHIHNTEIYLVKMKTRTEEKVRELAEKRSSKKKKGGFDPIGKDSQVTIRVNKPNDRGFNFTVSPIWK